MSEGMTYAWEPIASLVNDENQQLVLQHWREIGIDHADVPLDGDLESFLDLERAGKYRIFVARRDGKIAGYLPLVLWYPSRYKSTLFVQDDTIYVVPGERNRGRLWFDLIERAIECLPRPCKFQMRVRPEKGGDRIGKILEKRFKMHISDVTYSVVLKE